MFEAVIALCSAFADGPCREALLPGYEAATKGACLAALAARPPDTAGMTVWGAAHCELVGETLTIEEVAPGVFVHSGAIEAPDRVNRGDVSNAGFVIGEDSVAVIDSGGARWVGEALWRAVRARTDKPVSHVILTHLHPDHVFGASVFADAGAVVAGHPNLSRALSDRRANYNTSMARLVGEAFLGSSAVEVDLLVEDRLEIDLGGRALDLRAWPVAHSVADVTVTDRATGTLFAGDLVFDRHTPALDGSVVGWLAVLDALRDEPIELVVPGHGAPVLPWPEGSANQRRYLDVLGADARKAVSDGARLNEAVEVIAESEREAWALFDEYNKRNATVAYTEFEWE